MHLPDVWAAARTAVRAAGVGEISWTDRDGRVQVRGVVPLASPAGPVLALRYADAELARSVGAAASVVLSLTEPRSAGTAWKPLALRCTPGLAEDPEGDRFTAELLEQELAAYPPSRLLADSILLRRENWWWLPRLLVDLTVAEVTPIAPRTTAADHLLVTEEEVRTVTVDDTDLAEPRILTGADDVPAAPAVLFGQDVSLPDLERWAQWGWRGTWDGAAFTATSVPDRTGLPPAPGLLERWRRQRALERACRRGLAAAAARR